MDALASSNGGGTPSTAASTGRMGPLLGVQVPALQGSMNSDRLNQTHLSVTSLASRGTHRTAGSRTCSQGGSQGVSQTPTAAGYNEGSKQRRFSSRHVPAAAEILAKSPDAALSPEIVSRFSGLMRFLKPNSDWQEHQKQVMVSCIAEMVPEEYDETVRAEFERRCSFGERINTELMTSAKWVRLLKDIGAVLPPDEHQGHGSTSSTVPLAQADIVFRKVLHDCDYGGKRLTYELFCKAMYIVAQQCRQDLDSEAAFAELLAGLVAIAPEENPALDQKDLMLDPHVNLVLDNFKPALFDLFKTFCGRNLSNPADASHGTGLTRIRERTVWKHTQDTMLSGTHMTSASFYRGGSMASRGGTLGLGGRSTASQVASASANSAYALDSGYPSNGSTPVGNGNLDDNGNDVGEEKLEIPSPSANSEADAGGGYASPRGRQPQDSEADEQKSGGDLQQQLNDMQRVQQAQQLSLKDQHLQQQENLVAEYQKRMQPGDAEAQQNQLTLQRPQSGGGGFGGTMMTDRTGTVCSSVASKSSATTQDPYVYANGAPVIRNRNKHMSIDQLQAMCRELKIFPELLNRVEIVNIFKRAQCAGASSSHGQSSLYGFLNSEAFVDCAGQIALEAYSKSPYAEEYPAPHEKISAFFLNVLPGSSREVRDRFLYGCGGRGRI